jgi:hypothetical protein
VQALTRANFIRRAAVRAPGRSGIDIAVASSSTGDVGASAGLTGMIASTSAARSNRP